MIELEFSLRIHSELKGYRMYEGKGDTEIEGKSWFAEGTGVSSSLPIGGHNFHVDLIR